TKNDHVWMDRFTIRNLELYQSYNQNAVTLIEVIDRTISPMGGRLLKRWLAFPLIDIDKINQRHDVVQYFLDNPIFLKKIQDQIKYINDIERLISKVATVKICPREVVQLKNALDAIVPIKALTQKTDNKALKHIGDGLQLCEELRQWIKETLIEEAPVNILKGNTISSDFSSELKELRTLSTSGKDYLEAMLQREIEITGITSLKIASNNVFGYYIEVRHSQRDKVPAHW